MIYDFKSKKIKTVPMTDVVHTFWSNFVKHILNTIYADWTYNLRQLSHYKYFLYCGDFTTIRGSHKVFSHVGLNPEHSVQ